ncbi:MAG: GvpL/GvpF family gas vesicle protein [Elusimicrobia bacterium]|nr:GvpL/GvpF family gas vesicle protein [Elusimicrobiota bacterium]
MARRIEPGQLLYLYCVADRAPDLNKGRDGSDRPRIIPHEGLYAVARRVSRSDFDEDNLKRNLSDLAWVETRVIAHEQVLEAVMKDSCMVPFKFATLFDSEDNLKGMLARNAPLLKEALENVAGHEEWGLKIYCDMDALEASLRQNKELSELDHEIASSSPGKAFILKRRQEARLRQMMRTKLNECGQESFDRLRGLCSRARINRLLPKEATEKNEDMILNAAFLIRKPKVRAFIETVAWLKARQAESGLSFDCTGPWPPYNFCDVVERTADHARP